MQTQQIEHITRQFIADLETALNDRTTARLRDALGAVGIPMPEGPTKYIGTIQWSRGARAIQIVKPRKKMPIQLCPVPGCKAKAAPALNMMCSEHRNTPKRLVAKYRAARRAAKAAAKGKRS